MARGLRAAVTVAVGLGLQLGAAAAENVGGDICADPGGFCSQRVSADCLARYGAGAIAASSAVAASSANDGCPAELAAYRDCIADAAASCGASRPQRNVSACAPEDARELWRDVKDSASAEELEAFAEACQGSPQARLAATRAKLLRAGAAADETRSAGAEKQEKAIEEVAAVEAADERGVSAAGVYKDWSAFVTDRDKDRRCWAATTPKSKRPASAGANAAGVYFMLATFTDRDARNQASVVLGFEPPKEAQLQLRVDGQSFQMFSQDGSAWLRSAEEDEKLVAAMKQGATAEVAITMVPDPVTFVFSLAGVSKALERVGQLCS